MWSMMCDVMPTISEDSIITQQPNQYNVSNNFKDGAANFEQLMVNILVERDKVLETLRETQDQLNNTKNKLNEIEKERDSLQNQLNDSLPQEFGSLTRELNLTRKQMNEKDEELQELKAERNNTRLLLEHLECLVSRHERGLRMTVAKRQNRTPAGVSSEVEVLKALKSLFEHHKALDEKVREKLRCSLERINQLEEELAKAQEEAVKAKVEKQSSITENGDLKDGDSDANSLFKLSITESEVQEMKTLIEKQSDELHTCRARIQELMNNIKDLEESIKNNETQLVQIKDENFKLKDSLRENNAQKKDQEQRISTLEDRYLNAQRESTGLHDMNEKLSHETKNKDAQLKLANEKIDALKEKIELTEQKLTQLELSKKQETLIKEASVNNEDQEHHKLSLEERIARLENQLEEKNSELHRARQREKMNEEHNQRLSATVDKLLAESNERLQMHLKERMSALEEKNTLQQELEKTRKQLDETQNEKQKGLLEQSKLKTEMDSLKQDIQQYKSDQYPSLGKSYKKSAISLYHERGWENRVENSLSNNLNGNHLPNSMFNSNHPSTYDASESDSVQTDDNESLYSTLDNFGGMQSSQTEAQQLALMLQEQLDAINNEIRLIQEEKQNTEQRTEELESQVGSIDSMNILSRTGRPYESQSHLIGLSPTHSSSDGRSSPKLTRISPTSRDYLPQLIIPSELQQQQSIYSQLLPNNMHTSGSELSDSSNYDDQSPGTPRAIRLQRAAQQMHEKGGSNYSIPDILPRPLSVQQNSEIEYHRRLLPNIHLAQQHQLEQQLNQSNYSLYTSSPLPQKKKGIKSSLVSKLFSSKRDKLKAQQEFYGGTNYFIESNDYLVGAAEQQQLVQKLTNSNSLLNSTSSTPINCASPSLGQKGDFDRRNKVKEDLLEEAIRNTSFVQWNGPTLVAWLELCLKMPSWYIAACRSNVKSGQIMASLSDNEIQREIGISNPLHRLKLRLAIQEMVALTSPTALKPTQPSLAYGDMDHEWIGNKWLPSLGLSQYRTTFMECLVDARMLEHLTKKEFRLYLKMVDAFHRRSLKYGIQCLKRLNYDKQALEERCANAENEDVDALVWGCDRVIKWLNKIGLKEFSNNLIESGVHGALIALDDSFDSRQMAICLKIPTTNMTSRQILDHEFDILLRKATDREVTPKTNSDRLV